MGTIFFKIKPYSQKYRNRNRGATGFSYIFNILSASSAFTFVCSFLASLFVIFLGEYSLMLGVPLTVIVLILLEMLKRDTAQDFFRDIKQLGKVNYKALSLIVFLVAVSAVLKQ